MDVEQKLNKTVVKLRSTDITDLAIEAFVYYASEDLNLGSGFGGAISVRGGPSIQEELSKIGPIKTGEVVVTEAGNMKAGRILHAAGPKFQEENLEKLLRQTVVNTLKLADENGIKTLAFPPMGVGFYGVPKDVSARIMTETFKEYLAGSTGIEEIIICVYDSGQFETFKAALT